MDVPPLNTRMVRCCIPVVVLLVFLSTFVRSPIHADEPVPLSGLRTLVVPADQPESWLGSGWEIVERDEFERVLRQRLQPKSQRDDVQITDAQYQANFVDGQLRGGMFQAEIVTNAARDTLLPIDPFGLAVSDLVWQNKTTIAKEPQGPVGSNASAILGRTKTGELQLVVPAVEKSTERRTLMGKWSLAGQATEESVSFDIRLLPATTSTMTLTLPDQFKPTSSVGVVSRVDQPPVAEGTSRWQIDLGHVQTFELRIQRVPHDAAQSHLVTEREISWILQPTEAQIQARFDLTVSDRPTKTLEFLLPESVQLYAVTYGGESVLSWRVASTRNRRMRRVSVELPEPLLGKGRPIRLSGLMPFSTTQMSHLPTIELESSALLGSRTILAISNQLEIEQLVSDGYRQTKTANTPSGQTTFTFEQMTPKAALRLHLAKPKPQPSVQVLSWLDTRSSHWRLQSRVMVSTHAGQTFSVVCRLSDDWEPTDIRSLSGAKVGQWELGKTSGGQKSIEIEFREAVTPERPVELMIHARRLPTSITRQVRLPLLHAENPTSWSSVIGVTSAADESPRTISSEPANVRISKSQLPAYVVGQLADDMLASSEHVQLFHFRTLSDHADLMWDHTEATFTAKASLLAELQGRELNEQMTVSIDPSQNALSGIDLALRSPASDWSWQLLQNDKVIRSLDPVRHAHIPSADGRDRYHFRIEPPISGQFQIVGTGATTYSESSTVELPTVPNARAFSGVVELECPESDCRIATENLHEISSATDESDSLDMIARRKWAYEQSDARLAIHLPPPTSNREEFPLAEMRVSSTCSLGANGWDRYRVVYSFYNPRGSEPRRFLLPKSARLEATIIDDVTQSVTKVGNEYELPQASSRGMRDLEIRYSVPTRPVRFRALMSPMLPTVDVRVVRSKWDVTTPAEWELVAANGSANLTDQEPGPTLSQRLFGPLGLGPNDTVFNPFAWSDWKKFFNGQPADIVTKSPMPSNVESLPDWTTHRVVSESSESLGTLEFVQHRTFRLAQWWLLLFCCLAGVTIRVLGRSVLFWCYAVWFSAALAGSLILSSPYAECCGAMTSGLILATLLPIAWMQRNSHRPDGVDSDIDLGSTATIQRSSLILRAFLIIGTYSLTQLAGDFTIGAAEPLRTTPQDSQILPQQWDILFPRDRDETPLDYVYVRKELWKSWRKATEADSQPQYLLTRSNIQVETTQEAVLNIVAKLTVIPLNNDGCVVTLPLLKTRLAERADCLLNGQPCFPTTNSKTGHLEIEIPARIPDGPAVAESTRPGETISLIHPPHEIELRLRAPNLENAMQGQLQLKLLRLPEAHVSMRFSQAVASIQARTTQGMLTKSVAIESAAWNVGPVDEVDLSWNSSSEIIESRPNLKLTARGVITEHPLRTHQSWKLACEWEDETESSCLFWLPREAHVEQITAADLASSSNEVFDQRRRIRLEFQSTPKRKATVGLEYSLPSRIEDQKRVLATADFPMLSSNRANTSEVDYAIGLSPVTGYDIVPQTMRAVPPTKLLPERFLTEFHADSTPAGKRLAPEVIYQMEPGTRFEFQLVPKQPRRQVRLEQAGRLRDRELLWDVNGEVTMTTSAAFQHTLLVPRELEIDSVSILEDETERLARWSRSGERITLFLSNGSTGTQRLQLRGHQKIYPDTEHALPLVSVLQARHEDTTIRLFSDSTLDVRLSNMPHENDGETKSKTDSENELKFLAELSWTHPPDVNSPDANAIEIPTIRYSDRPLEVQVDLATAVSLDEMDDRLEIRWLMRLMNNDCAARPFALTLPPEVTLTEAMEMDGDVTTALIRDEGNDGGTLLKVVEPLPPGGSTYLVLTGSLPRSGHSTTALPEPQLQGGEFFSRVIGSTPPLMADVSESKVLTSPNWLETLPELDFPDDQRFLELSTGEEPIVMVESVDVPALIQPVVETEIHWLGTRSLSARTLIAMPSGPATTLELAWPDHAELVGLLIDDLIAVPAEIQKHRLTVELPSSSTTRTIEMVSNHMIPQHTGSISDSLGEADWSIPRLTSPSVEVHGVTLFEANAIRIIPARPANLDPQNLLALERRSAELLAEIPNGDESTSQRIQQLIALRNSHENLGNDLPASDRNLVASWLLPSEKALPRVWVLKKTTEQFVVGGLLFIVALVMSGLVLLVAQRWTERAKVSLILLGVLWWACLRWSHVGLVILCVACAWTLRKRRSDEATLEVPSVSY
ncbi:hypothetical protein [Thalassoroseus pseudoceratinae]|uniref:hypothetical protein n=1 Tax=Thalassoroseus pseudoceratinae TaxID=2713176 RepID=UPI00141F35FF|nr:hypothetical protein [Thalassoroseus pseudoceratinae]